MREYEFELRLCAHLEQATEAIVARQLAGSVHHAAGRVLDLVLVHTGEAFEQRRAITPETIPPEAIECEIGPGRARPWPGSVDLHPQTARRVLERGVEVGFLERVRRKGRTYVRQTVRYPDWVDAMTAIENKPDLDRPGALGHQLQYDVRLGLFDRVILATRSHVTGAHLNRIPDVVGVWRVSEDGQMLSVEEIRPATRLPVSSTGIEILARHPARVDISVIPPTEKARMRTRIAERAYGKGWRPAFPACAAAAVAERSGSASLPLCTWKNRIVDPGSCGPTCPGYSAAEPPDVDRSGERGCRTPWEPDPPGVTNIQSRLDAFDDAAYRS